MENTTFEKFKEVRVYKEQGKWSVHKPILLLYALSQCRHKKEQLLSFYDIDRIFKECFLKFNFEGKAENSHYPFGKLENDGIWEITNSKQLKRTSVGHLFKNELLEKNIYGGFTKIIYDELALDNVLIDKIVKYILETYIDDKLHQNILHFLGIENNNKNPRNQKMALIGNETFALSRWQARKIIGQVKVNRKVFSTANIREIMKELIAGSGVVKGIRGWILAAQLIENIKTGEYELTDFARTIDSNDANLTKSSTWWSIHISICFSERSEPYASFFRNLNNLSKDWISWNDLKNKIDSAIKDSAAISLDKNLQGVRGMFQEDRPLADLGLIEIRKDDDDKQIYIRLGSPKIADQIIIHALAMMRFHSYKMRSGIDFSEILKTGLAHFLCCSPEELRKHLWRMEQSHNWKDYFSFTNAVNLESLSFTEHCNPRETVLLLLQSGEDTWL
ncbi:MAG: DUF4007 family protein [Methylococcaceae bacterium]|nr:MAG: DUF4007 family protein [Methylococcaceae bacterium]